MPWAGKMSWGCFRKAQVLTERHVKANDHAFNSSFKYINNFIKTSKYNVLTFLPINLFEQFQRVANLYFLLQIIIMSIPQITALNPLATAVPLVIVLAATGIKDSYDDYGRHKSDNRVNNRSCLLLKEGRVKDVKSSDILVGEIVKLESNQHVPADLLVLSTSEPNGLCYIETADLDGETNLKVRQPLTETSELGGDLQLLSSFDGEVICELPNNRLDKFDGTLNYEDDQYSIDNGNILLRGCILRNTDWVYGLVIFAGHDTKLMMNSGEATLKRTKIDKMTNLMVIWIAFGLLGICLFLSIMSGIWESSTGEKFQIYLPWETFYKDSPALIAVFHFPAFIMVLNTLIPISLYISIEFIRLGQSFLIDWDLQMYHEKSDTPARARNTTLNEELGQIEYIFSDKTGTLTQNIMTFKECSINGIMYGHDEDGAEENRTGTSKKRIDFCNNQYADPKFEFFDTTLTDAISNSDKNVAPFFKLLAICHTVMVEQSKMDVTDFVPSAMNQDQGSLVYQAQSPDEGALVSASRNFGYVFKNRTPNSLTVECHGVEEEYEMLCFLDFNNVRKRMSVLVKCEGKITLFCKGADTMIYERLAENQDDLCKQTQEHLDVFACSGLRTLCLAYREIEEEEFLNWWDMYKEASCSLEDRDEKLSEVYEEIEKNMILLGATAIEDKLQEGVPETIANLAEADMKIWVLTGDKQETAVNIGYSCMLLTENLVDVLIINGNDAETVADQISAFTKRIKDSLDVEIDQPIFDLSNDSNEQVTPIKIRMSDQNGEYKSLELQESQASKKDGFALVINGNSLAFALQPEVEMDFLELGKCCKAVICCRVTPLQKALVVDLVKRHVKAVTLAIGDGANDVSMIKAAHVGIGISGQEGLQAVLSSDLSIAQFRFLERLLLVHGRWSYMRMSKFLRYFFYKNFSFTLVQFWFNLFVGFSAQTLYDTWFLSVYNVCFTSLPVLALGIFDQDVDDKKCLEYPKLYVPGQKGRLFNRKIFFMTLVHGTVTSCLIYFLCHGAFYKLIDSSGRPNDGVDEFGTAAGGVLVFVVTIQIAVDTSHWTWINHFFIWGSVVFYFCYTLFLGSSFIHGISPSNFYYVGIANRVYQSWVFWFALFLTLSLCILPAIGYKWISSKMFPSLSDLVRRGEWKERKRLGLNIFARGGTRRSFRSGHVAARSGYAFSHQQGFGDLIMSGKWLPKLKSKKSQEKTTEESTSQ